MRAAFRWLAITALATVSGCGPQSDAGAVRAQALQKLTRGVNLSNWFVFRDGDSKPWHPETEDFQRMQRLGLQHVRVLVDPAWLLDDSGSLRAVALAELRAAISAANAQQLLFVLALQPDDATKLRLAAEPAALQRYAGFCATLAEALKDFSPTQLVVEPLNEPTVEDPARVREMLSRIVAAIRKPMPAHLLAVSGAHFSDVADLVQMQPLDDPGLVYSFHFYEPHNFTHQGALWGWPMWQKLHSLPYPSSPEAVAPILETLEPEAREHAAYYGEQRWNRDKLAATIEQAAAWGRQHQKPLWCSEFGVLRWNLRNEDRVRWLRDVRELLEARGIRWTHWDYAGAFGLVRGEAGARELDDDAIAALGLNRGD